MIYIWFITDYTPFSGYEPVVNVHVNHVTPLYNLPMALTIIEQDPRHLPYYIPYWIGFRRSTPSVCGKPGELEVSSYQSLR